MGDCWGYGLPGFEGMKLAKGSIARMGYTPSGYEDTGGSLRLHFPDGNATIARLLVRDLLPGAVPGIAFLSGGQTPTEAALHLSLMNHAGPLPWQLSFSYGRALQDAALSAWAGKPGNAPAAQKEFQKWARLNGLARNGTFKAGMEQQAA